MNFSYVLLIVFCLVVVGGFIYIQRPFGGEILPFVAGPTPTPVDNTVAWPPQEPEQAASRQLSIAPIREDVAVILRTSMGDIHVTLQGRRAPVTVGNFVKLARQDFYDGTSFHRVIPDFMIQGGDPFSKDQSKRDTHGTGGPGYTFPDEINVESYGLHEQVIADSVPEEQQAQLPEEIRDMTAKQFYEAQGYQYRTDFESLPITRGVMAMANSGPNTNGSQFFIVTAPEVPQLNGRHTPFGVVTDGIEVVDAISAVETDERDNPLEPVVVQDVVIEE